MRVAIAVLTLALCACGRESTFDERYSEAANEIEDRTRELDEQLNEQDRNSVSGGESEAKLD